MNKGVKFICDNCSKILLKKNKSRHLELCLNNIRQIQTYKSKKIGGDLELMRARTGGDLQNSSVISKLLKPITTEKYPGERHLFRHNYTGPGTRLDIRLDSEGNPKPGEEPINQIDAAALNHDISYNSTDIRDRHIADVNLIHDLNKIQDPSGTEKFQRAFVKLAMKGKIVLGQSVAIHKGTKDHKGYKKSKILKEDSENESEDENKNILDSQKVVFDSQKAVFDSQKTVLADELHKDYRKTKHFRKVIVYEKDDIWSADLIFQGINRKGKNVILTVIDLYTRFAFIELSKNRTGKSTTNAFERILEKSKIELQINYGLMKVKNFIIQILNLSVKIITLKCILLKIKVKLLSLKDSTEH